MSRLDDEIRTHLEQLEAEHRRRGLSPEEARAAAQRDFGGVTVVKERYSEQQHGRWIHDLQTDVRHAFRTLRGAPGFTLLVVVTLGLGIGANTAIFSVLNGVVLKPLPYAAGDRLLVLEQAAPLGPRPNVNVSVRELYDYREQTQAFDALVEYHQMTFDLLNRGEPDRVNAGVVSHDFFNILGIQPIGGRTFQAADDATGAEAVLVLSYKYWQSRFGGDPRILGAVFEMNDRPHTVVGILPDVPQYPQENDVYMPVSACPFRAAAEQASISNRRAFAGLTVFGRVKAAVTRERAVGEVAAVGARFSRENPASYRPAFGFRASASDVRDKLVSEARPLLAILLGATGLILLIACANVANLTLARLLRRHRELAVRAALGAGRGRLLRQLLTESTLLALLGAVVGTVLASSTLTMLTTFVSRFTSRTGEVSLDARVLAFTVFVAMLTGLAFGVLPALMAGREFGAVIRGGRGTGDTPMHRRVQGGLVVAQVAVSVVLLSGAVLLLASFYRLQQVDAGYRTERVVAAEAFGNFSKYPNGASLVRFYESVITRLGSETGVAAVAVSDAVPLGTAQPFNAQLRIEGMEDDPQNRPIIDPRVASPGYFPMLGIRIVQGRVFNQFDHRDAAPVAVINEAMLPYWNGRSPIDTRISVDNGQTWKRVVGVVGNVRQFGLERDAIPQLYTPLAQSNGLTGQVLVRINGDERNAGEAIRAAVRALDPQMPVENVRTLEEIRREYLTRPQLTATLLLIFAGIALIVTLAGIGGVMALSVSNRLKEFGVRLALGASRGRVLGGVLRQGGRLIAVGLLFGLGVSMALQGSLRAYLFETVPTDPIVLGLVVAILAVTGLLACVSPAWRATRVAPTVSLQAE